MKPLSAFVNLAIAILLCSLAAQAQQVNNEPSTAAIRTLPPPATVTGSGTTNYIPRWTGSTTLGNSVLFQTGGKIGLNTTTPTVALDVSGRVNVSKSYRIAGNDVLIIEGNPGANNLGVGYEALQSLSSGFGNTAVGGGALTYNTAGENNTALGAFALNQNKGSANTAVGDSALGESVSGTQNTAVGSGAMLFDSDGFQNTALGYGTLLNNTTGNSNIAIGYQAALNVSAGNSNNIHIGSEGFSADSGVIRIGTTGAQSSFFVAGVSGVTTGVNDAVPVVIDTNGQLGTISSSRRFKEDIQEMGDASQGLMRLRPVTFRYRKAFTDGSKPMQYGLVAEEVAEVYPDLVAHSADGQIETVKYQVLDSMLLNEVQRQQREIQGLQERLAKMEAMLASTERTK